MSILRRAAGLALLVTAYAPLHRLLRVEGTGPAGAATVEATETAWVLGLSGTVIVLVFAWLLARVVPSRSGADPLERPAAILAAVPPGRFALGLGAVAGTLATGVALAVHGGAPTSVDEMAQLFHAAALAGGRLTVPLDGSAAAWIIQNGIVVDGGWASIYPPMHTLLLAGGLLLGASWLVDPFLVVVATAAFTRGADELLGPKVGRLAGALLCVSPFWLLLGASHASHPAAACGLALVLLCAVRARGAGAAWAVATGAATGLAVGARPWTGLLCSAAIIGSLWWPGARRAMPIRRWGHLVAGGLPFAAILLAWNSSLFGSPLRLGYSAAFGPAHALGLHEDPWGNRYGAVEALAYTGADLLTLGVRLFEGPLPALALVGGALLLAPLRRGSGVFVAWAAAGTVAVATYWHHGIHFGPRMLFESVPAWAALFAVAVASLARGGPYSTSGTAGRFVRWTALVTVAGGIALAPTAIRSYAAVAPPPALPEAPTADALIFVHGSWSSRIASRLAANGMRRDSIETALRRNDVCAVDRYARWRQGGTSDTPPPLDLAPAPGTPDGLAVRELSPGNRVRIDPATAFDARCLREARADRWGVLELELLAWRHPPLGGASVVAARDLGPAANLAVLSAYGRPAYVVIDRDGPVLLDYDEGMELIWGGAAGETTR